MAEVSEVPKIGEGREKLWTEEIQKILRKYRTELLRNVKARIAAEK